MADEQQALYVHCKDFIDSSKKEVLIEESPTLPLFVHGGVNYWEASYRDVVVIPSYSFDAAELAKIDGITHYEERHLYNLILLRRAHTRIIYVTSMPLDSSIIEYYWKLLPGNVPFHAIRHRLILLSVHDASPKPLSEKVLERPRLINRVKKSIRWGTKAGSKKIFQECGVLSPPGTKFTRDPCQLAKMILELCEKFPKTRNLMIKLNDGFSGEGNAILNLVSPGGDSEPQKVNSIMEGFKTMKFQGKGETGESFIKKIKRFGAIAEVFIEDAIGSPSFQAVVNTTGEVHVLSTHEQVLGGDDHQIYIGCKFPASEEYRLLLQDIGTKVGNNLAQKGIIDHFGVDFVVFSKHKNKCPQVVKNKSTNENEVYAIEINLRQGGTTHPMMTLKLLTDGVYDKESGNFLNKSGKQRFYIASDNLQKEMMEGEIYKGLLPHDIMEVFLQHQLHWNKDTETGVVFHLLGALSEYGKIGVTCIGESPNHSQYIYDNTVELLDQIANECKSKRADLWNSEKNVNACDIPEAPNDESEHLLCHMHPALLSITPK